jgi:hypothetical protein
VPPPAPFPASVRDGWRCCGGTLPVGAALSQWSAWGEYGAGHSGHDMRARQAESPLLGKGRARRGEDATMSRRDRGKVHHLEECNESANRARC